MYKHYLLLGLLSVGAIGTYRLMRAVRSPVGEAVLIGLADGYLARARATGSPAIVMLDSRDAGRRAAQAGASSAEAHLNRPEDPNGRQAPA